MTGLRLFSIRGIPVWVSPMFFLLSALYVSELGWRDGILLTLCAAVSIVVHELGHAFVAAHYKLAPRVMLHGLGGYCEHERAARDRDDALIVAAGPGAGLVLGGIVIGLREGLAAGGVVLGRDAITVLWYMVYINIGWSLLNLLPMWPLDGGRLFRLGLLQLVRPEWAERVTHAISILLLGAGAIYGFRHGSMFLGFIAIYFLYQNLRVILGEAPGDTVRRRNPRVKAMLADVQAAYAAGDDAEVLLRGHRLREESYVPDAVVRKLFAMLGVSTARLGRHQEALAYLQRASVDADVVEALVECLHMLDRERELDAVLGSPAFRLVPAARRREILEVVRPGRAVPSD